MKRVRVRVRLGTSQMKMIVWDGEESERNLEVMKNMLKKTF